MDDEHTSVVNNHYHTVNNAASVKGQKPFTFNGHRKQLKLWLIQCDVHFTLNATDPTHKGVLATTFMTGEALEWIQPYLERYLDTTVIDPEIKQMFENWAQFKAKSLQAFGIHTEKTTAEKRIQEIKQTTSVAMYIQQFQKLSIVVEWDDMSLQRMFKQGLKPQVLEELMRSGCAISNLGGLMEEAKRLDEALYELETMKRGYGKTPNSQNSGRKRASSAKGNHYQPNRGTQRGFYTSNGSEPMHLDNINKPRTWKTKHPRDKKKKNTCYGCGKEGHYIRDCEHKNKVTRQINMISHQSYQPSNEEWEVISPLDLDHTYNQTASEEAGMYEESQIVAQGSWNMLEPSDREQELQKKADNHGVVDNSWEEPHPGTKVAWEDMSAEEFFAETRPNYISQATMEDKPDKGFRCTRCKIKKTRCEPAPQGGCERCTKLKKPCEGFNQQRWEEYRAWTSWRTPTLNIPNNQTKKRVYYSTDYRNAVHPETHWRRCTHDECPFHEKEKTDNGHFPQPSGWCRRDWYDCDDDECPNHLWDKRNINYFYGHTAAQEIERTMIVNGACVNKKWQVCMNHKCIIHADDKLAKGFDLRSFLDHRNRLNEIQRTREESKKKEALMRWRGDTNPYELEFDSEDTGCGHYLTPDHKTTTYQDQPY